MKPFQSLNLRSNVGLLIILMGSLVFSCSSKNGESNNLEAQEVGNSVPFEVSEEKTSLAAYYKLEHIREWYPERILPPAFDFSIDLSKKSLVELWLLRNEIFARNGYLFEDAILRGHFNQFKWYQPIFDVPEFNVQLSQQEQEFVNSILDRENELKKNVYVQSGEYTMINMDHVYNQLQFKEVPKPLTQQLAENNFAIVPAKHEQFFHVYDKNHYEYIPSFITTDIYLQLLHKHFSTMLQKIEEEKFISLLSDLLKSAYQQSIQFENSTTDEQLKKASQWSTTYLAISFHLLSREDLKVPVEMRNSYEDEIEKILAASGTGSNFLQTNRLAYSQFNPRGNYTKTLALENYFRCVKWLNTAPIYIQEDERFLSALLIASSIKKSTSLFQSFEKYNEAIKFIVGDEDNLSLAHLIKIISFEEASNPALLQNPEKLQSLRKRLEQFNVSKINPQGGDAVTQKELSQQSVLFTAGRYTFDGEIFSKLVHVLQPNPRRPFPKALDVFAVFGNQAAENILLNEYNEEQQCPGYSDKLSKLKDQFKSFKDWDSNIYSKTFQTINVMNGIDSHYPPFMRTPSWERKNLNTSLAAWTELKHDMLLYSEQPFAAQAGQGGGPPPPQHLSYVEPNVPFWKKSIELIELQGKTLEELDLVTDNLQDVTKELQRLAKFFLSISEKEIRKEPLTDEEFDMLSWIGGDVENLTFKIFNSDHLPEKERLVGLVADVYQYNSVFLEEAVGMVDEIYVVVEINGKPYITKGAIFSYYEFNSDKPLTDEEWQSQLLAGEKINRPAWLKKIIVDAPSLESKPNYSF